MKLKTALPLALFLTAIPGTIAVLRYLTPLGSLEVLSGAGLILTAVGLFLGVLTLRETHEWNRRHYTVELMASWKEVTIHFDYSDPKSFV